MPYRQPSTKWWLYSGVELDKNYENSVYFGRYDSTAYMTAARNRQLDFFGLREQMQDTVYDSFKWGENYTHQRIDLGYIDVEAYCEEINHANYLIFTNPKQLVNGSDRYYFAFVDRVEYIAELTSRIYYTIDVLQTYMFDYDLPECFVERQHSKYDTLLQKHVDDINVNGTFVVRESYDIPRSSVTTTYNDLQYELYGLHIVTSEPLKKVEGVDDYNGVSSYMNYTEAYCYVIPIYNLSVDNRFNNPFMIRYGTKEHIAKLLDYNSTTLIQLYVAPILDETQYNAHQTVVVEDVEGSIELWTLKCATQKRNYALNVFSRKEAKNKRLHSSPYSYYRIYTENNSIDYKPEYLPTTPTNKLDLNIYESVYPNYNAYLSFGDMSGSGYCGIPNGTFANGIASAYQNDCTMNKDSYMAYKQEHGRANTMGIVVDAVKAPVSVVSGALSVLGGSPSGAITATNATFDPIFNPIMNRMNAIDAADRPSSVAQGNLTAQMVQPFFISYVTLDDVSWGMLDEQFTIYGYAQKQVMKIDREARPYWTYVKAKVTRLNGANLVPSNHAETITKAYNRGITWWNGKVSTKWKELFDYSKDNSPS